MSDEQPQMENEGTVGQSVSTGGLARKACDWYQDGDYDSDTWATGCKHLFIINEGTPEDNRMAFCCYCGGEITQHLQDDPDDDEG